MNLSGFSRRIARQLAGVLDRLGRDLVAVTKRTFQPRPELVPIRIVADRGPGRASVIDFPNHSRSYDSTRRAVRFWGHDSAMEASFFVSEDALTRIQPGVPLDEQGLLKAFDANRDKICAAAAKLYVRGGRGSYDLDAANF